MKKKNGSLTVETSLILPMFLFISIALISIIEMISVYIRMEFAVHETAKEIADTAYITKEITEGGLPVTETVVCTLLYENYGLKQLDDSLIEGDALGIRLFRSELQDDEGCIDLIVTYKVEPLLNLYNIGSLNFCNRAKIHAWTGYSLSKTDWLDDEYVYITEKGEVYHTNPNCTYLHVSVITTDYSQIENMKNADGKKYEKCKLCFDGSVVEEGGPVYVTGRGEAIHTSLGCLGLKRTVYKIKLSEVGDRKECSRCLNYKTGRKKEDEGDVDSDYMLSPDGAFTDY